MTTAPLPHTWWVREGLLLAGGFPADYNKRDSIKELQRLLDVGVRCFVSLQQPNEMVPSRPFSHYPPLVEALARKMNIEVVCHNFPIVDMDVPDIALMTVILDTIDQCIREEQCVYVHCWGGHGRTGTVVGCWLRERGFSGEEALRQMQQMRRHDPYLVTWEAPQTDAQRNMILTWQPR